jgi:hypothetical protein
MEPYLNLETGWTPEEEQIMVGIVTEQSCDRMEAIRAARRKWIIGATRPPMWAEGRGMPKSNPRWTTDASQTGLKPAFPLDFRGSGASTDHGKALDSVRLQVTARKPASERQARWRAKRKEATVPVEQAA